MHKVLEMWVKHKHDMHISSQNLTIESKINNIQDKSMINADIFMDNSFSLVMKPSWSTEVFSLYSVQIHGFSNS